MSAASAFASASASLRLASSSAARRASSASAPSSRASSLIDEPERSRLPSSLRSSEPEPSGSHSVKSASISALGTLKPRSAIALWNSLRVTSPSPSSSQSRKRSMTRTAALESASRSCSATLLPESSSTSKCSDWLSRRPAELCRPAEPFLSGGLSALRRAAAAALLRRLSATACCSSLSSKASPERASLSLEGDEPPDEGLITALGVLGDNLEAWLLSAMRTRGSAPRGSCSIRVCSCIRRNSATTSERARTPLASSDSMPVSAISCIVWER